MYEIGSLILYGRTGICRVDSISENADSQIFYTLKPLYQSCSITIPAESDKVFTRPIISADEAHRLIDIMPSLHAEPYYNRNLNQLREHYRSCIDSHSCEELIRLTKSLHLKRTEMESTKRKFGAVDERFMREAEDLLFGEFAAALGIERENVRNYIADRLAMA